jgi:hypothetical protein
MQTALIEKITVLYISHVALLVNRRKFAQLLSSSMKDKAARRLYDRESFLSLLDQLMRLLRPAADIRAIF